MKLYDAHNHLQDDRFGSRRAALLDQAKRVDVAGMVVNGSSEADWRDVESLARAHDAVIPSYGLHPWYHHERSGDWLDLLGEFLADERAGVGEIGLDRWKEDLPFEEQEAVFLEQWGLAVRLNRPASIHCLRAWGKLLDLLRANPGPDRGFLLHSYGGSMEMVPAFVKLGAYFSFPGYYARENKSRQRAVFQNIPENRLLIETDAPDQLLPDDLNRFPMEDPEGRPINHPANLAAIYEFAAELRGMPVEELAAQVGENFQRLFG